VADVSRHDAAGTAGFWTLPFDISYNYVCCACRGCCHLQAFSRVPPGEQPEQLNVNHLYDRLTAVSSHPQVRNNPLDMSQSSVVMVGQ
jgi:hypothetical protein